MKVRSIPFSIVVFGVAASLDALVGAKEYGLARQVLEFIAAVRPKGR
jgi:hypothetical protein